MRRWLPSVAQSTGAPAPKSMSRAIALMALLGTGFAASASQAETSDELVRQLTAQIAELTARLEAVETAQAKKTVPTHTYAPPAATAQAVTQQSSWTDDIKLKGDFRYRHEAFDVDDRRDRHRQRVRARVGLTGKVAENVSAGFGLATGSSDPISTNQTLGDGSSSKGVVIDLAYVNWQTPLEGMAVRAGKFKNPLHRAGGNGLIWDGDLNPEGVGVTFARGNFFANGLASWVDESSSDDDSFLLGGQFGMNHEVSENGVLLAGAGYYNYLDSRGEVAFFDGSAAGNRLNAQGEYISDFELIEGFVEYQTRINATKVTFFADYVQNLGASDYDQGYALGAKLKNGDWQASYTYQDLEADAVLGTFTDSDFIGGGTDGKGHIVSAGYALSERIALKGTLFFNKRNIDFGTEEDFKRLMLDISFKY